MTSVQNSGYSPRSWMSNLSDEAKQQPVNHLILPGTHNSDAYTLNYSELPKDSSLLFKIANFAANLFPFIGNLRDLL
jgi:hypothetical protein